MAVIRESSTPISRVVVTFGRCVETVYILPLQYWSLRKSPIVNRRQHEIHPLRQRVESIFLRQEILDQLIRHVLVSVTRLEEDNQSLC
jgi:hypothetical protein